jgi:Helix-turn-helix domain
MRKAKTITSTKVVSDFLTLKQLLRSLPIAERTLHRYIDAGKLRAYKLDGMLIFNTADIEAFLKRRSVGGGPTAPILKEPPAPAAAPAESRLLSDGEAKTFFDSLPVFVKADWKPPKGLLEFDN